MKLFGIIGQGIKNTVESIVLWINNTNHLKYSQMGRNIVMILIIIF